MCIALHCIINNSERCPSPAKRRVRLLYEGCTDTEWNRSTRQIDPVYISQTILRLTVTKCPGSAVSSLKTKTPNFSHPSYMPFPSTRNVQVQELLPSLYHLMPKVNAPRYRAD